MEYVQERVTTLHDLTDPTPTAPIDRAAVVVPMTEREYAGLAPDRVLSELERVDPGEVVVPLRAAPERVGPFYDWLDDFDLSLTVLWCNGPRLEALLDDHGLDGEFGKGRDVWLGLGQALDREYVVVHDADTKTYSRADVPRLLYPLAHGYDFSKGYYARVENDRLYGRLFRLFFVPLVRALSERGDASILRYLESFRYALAGEFAATTTLAEQFRPQRSWGLEIGTLGDAFDDAGFDGSAQVDLGTYEHDHRSVNGPTGLSDMSRHVGSALFRVVEEGGVDPDYDTLPDRYQAAARSLVRSYELDAGFNGLTYDRGDELDQIEAYVDAIEPPGTDRRLPPWTDAPLSPARIAAAAAEDLEAAR
ncbi:glycosyltransferase family protein [Haloplanus aerogenes]|uniref:Glucosyl-3-phosphoglycerate synthase n=1 Tax=Haloplanus aerogenes TaxID=660522 RepID=A0A3M0DEQ6_9EURY|nr:glycosyl transferase family 2 [Haloplanus aerogenes]AZH24951.1 glycosyl transferase family 2 [Haloplanus aerogenes]RMB13833.1 glucosyl-3-phosphoglycerate synthase [Haloplanus aerogenes]